MIDPPTSSSGAPRRSTLLGSTLLRGALLRGAPLAFLWLVAPRTSPAQNQPPAPPAAPLRLTIGRDVYALGQQGAVHVAVGVDGYLLVLHVDPEGHFRIAFPLDPPNSATVRAGTQLALTERGAPPGVAFTVEDTLGGGIWYAAISHAPFQTDSLVRGDHWDYRVFPTLDPRQDPERQITDFVGQLATAHFDYDIAGYRVVAHDSTTHGPALPATPTRAPPATPSASSTTPPPPPNDNTPAWASPRVAHGVVLDAATPAHP